MQTVAGLLQAKKTLDVCTIAPSATVFDAIKMLAEHNLGALIVTDHGQLRGLFSERDYARKVILQGRSSKECKVEEIMSTRVIFVSPSDTIDTCMEIMLKKYIRHLPVVHENQLIGIISTGDVVKAVLEERHSTIKNLVEYITDSPMMHIQEQQSYSQDLYYGVN